MLLQSGVPIINSLKIVSGALSNSMFSQAILRAIPTVEKGIPLAVPINEEKVFPRVLSRLIATGEETGKIDKVLQDMSNYYASEVDQKTNNLTKLMEPLILVVVGFVVALVAIAVYLPIFSLSSIIK